MNEVRDRSLRSVVATQTFRCLRSISPRYHLGLPLQFRTHWLQHLSPTKLLTCSILWLCVVGESYLPLLFAELSAHESFQNFVNKITHTQCSRANATKEAYAPAQDTSQCSRCTTRSSISAISLRVYRQAPRVSSCPAPRRTSRRGRG